MPYNPNIPVALETLKDSQPLLRINFSDMQNVFSNDHMLIGGNFNGGHAIIHFPVQASDPVPAADQIALYSKKYTIGTDRTELYFYKNGGTPIPGTAQNNSSSVYWTFLPNGLLMKFGEVTSAFLTATVNMKITGQPQFSSILTVMSSWKDNNASPTIAVGNYRASATINLLTIIWNGGGGNTYSYCVIGVGDPTPAP